MLDADKKAGKRFYCARNGFFCEA